MRYYAITVTPTSGKAQTWTSFPNGATDLGAQQVEMDLPIFDASAALSSAYVRIWGIPIQTISQASDLNGATISVYGGMQKGLPLANPMQSGLLISGTVLQAFGNWIGTDMTLDLFIVPGGAPTPATALAIAYGTAQSIVFNWTPGIPLLTAVQNALAPVYPDFKVTGQINPDIALAGQEIGYFGSINEFATFLKSMSANVVGGDYKGVSVSIGQNTLTLFDGTVQTTPIAISYLDLIGQPTWVGPGEIQVTVVMRADISVNSFVTLPQTQVTTLPQSMSQARTNSVFQGTFGLKSVRHVGNFRNPDATSWVTVLNMYPSTAEAPAQ